MLLDNSTEEAATMARETLLPQKSKQLYEGSGAFGYLIFSLFALHITLCHHHHILLSNGQFAIDVYNILRKDPGNLVFSPISAHAVLSMAYQGADGTTKEALASKLHLPEPTETADSYINVITDLNNASDVTVSFINKVYVGKEFQLDDEFSSTMKEKFLSEVGVVDFKQVDETTKEINQYVEDNTFHKIKDLFGDGELDPDTAVVLVNTLYFKAEWQRKLAYSEGHKSPFYLDSGEQVEVGMMSMNSHYNYKEDDQIGAQILEMPFKNSKFSILFALPKKGTTLAELESKFESDNPPNLLADLRMSGVLVSIPKFKIEKRIELKDVLQKLGLGELFEKDKCNLSRMVKDTPLYVDKAIQKVVIDVNEEGCEAAAATAMTGIPVSLPPFSFSADHPFLFSLIERDGEAVNILFSGRVSNPLD